MILPGNENPRNCVDPDDMKMRLCLITTRSPECVLAISQFISVKSGYRYTRRGSVHLSYPCISLHLPSLIDDVLGGRDCGR